MEEINGLQRNNSDENELNLSDIFRLVKANWLWFVVSITICISLSVYYIKCTPKQYACSAAVLIKDSQDGASGMASEAAAFQDLGLFNTTNSVDNEMLVFKSKTLMQKVVQRLHLDLSYRMKRGLRNVEQYRQTPLQLHFLDANANERFALTAKPLNDKQVNLSAFDYDTEEDLSEVNLNAMYYDTIQTPVGRLVVTPTLYLTEETYDQPIAVTKRNQKELALAYSNQIDASLASKKATVINLTLQDESQARAIDVLNTLIQIYNEEAISDKNKVTVSTSDFINERLIIIEKELGSVDANIASYKQENQLMNIEGDASLYLQESSKYNASNLSLSSQLTLVQYIRDRLNDPLKQQELIPANTGGTSPELQASIAEYNTLLLKRDKLIGNSSNKNPVVMHLNNDLNSLRQTILRTMDNLIVGLSIQIKNVEARESQTRQRIAAVPKQQKYVLSVERQQKIKEELYLYLLNKREENALNQRITESNARIIDPATGNPNPVAPKTPLILLVALVMGCGLPVGFYFVFSLLDTKVHTRKDVENAVTIPIIGEIPQTIKGFEGDVIVRSNSRDHISEAFRLLRNNILFSKKEDETGGLVMMLTSFYPDSGKTFLSINLAETLALSGKKVILVDMDLRKGTLYKRLYGKEQHRHNHHHVHASEDTSSEGGLLMQGVTDYLENDTLTVDRLICVHHMIPEVDLLYAGTIPFNPTELLHSRRMEELVTELRRRYDYVIFDCVPYLFMADASLVNHHVDRTFFVVRAQNFDKRGLPSLQKIYTQKKLKQMSIILNSVRTNTSSYSDDDYVYGDNDDSDQA